MAQPLRNFRELLQSQHAPYLLERGFGERALLGGERCAFGIEPQGAFLFWAELLQSRAHKRELNQLPPIGRFAVNHASILPPSSRNLPQGREQRKCPPRWAERAGVASAGSSCRSEIEYTPRAFGFLLIALTIQPAKIGSLTLQQARLEPKACNREQWPRRREIRAIRASVPSVVSRVSEVLKVRYPAPP